MNEFVQKMNARFGKPEEITADLVFFHEGFIWTGDALPEKDKKTYFVDGNGNKIAYFYSKRDNVVYVFTFEQKSKCIDLTEPDEWHLDALFALQTINLHNKKPHCGAFCFTDQAPAATLIQKSHLPYYR